jgi:hypothetical protein
MRTRKDGVVPVAPDATTPLACPRPGARMDPYLIFRQDVAGERCSLRPGTYTVYGPRRESWPDAQTGSCTVLERALIHVEGGNWLLAQREIVPGPDPTSDEVFAVEPRYSVWDSCRSVDPTEAADWLLTNNIELPACLQPAALGYDLAGWALRCRQTCPRQGKRSRLLSPAPWCCATTSVTSALNPWFAASPLASSLSNNWRASSRSTSITPADCSAAS